MDLDKEVTRPGVVLPRNRNVERLSYPNVQLEMGLGSVEVGVIKWVTQVIGRVQSTG